MQKAKSIFLKITEGANYVAMVCLVFVVVVIFLDVVIRLITSKSILGTYKMTEEAMIIIIRTIFHLYVDALQVLIAGYIVAMLQVSQ